MNKEEFKKITEYLDKMVILHQTTGETINKDLDISIRLSVAYEELEQENQKLKADYGNKAQVERDLLLEENQKYKEVIDKAILYINSTKYSDITGLEKHCIKEFWFIEELEMVLKEVE